jgi:hypothetical protein
MVLSDGDESGPYDVFLSHGAPDKAWVRTLYARLTSAGVVASLDEVAIEPGENFVRNLSQGIGQTSTFVIVVNQGTMERPWVEHEWTSFMATHGPGTRIILVLLDDVPLPPFVRPYQAIPALDHDVDAVATRIARAVGKGGEAADAPGRYTGRGLLFTIASADDADQLAVTSTDGVQRTVPAPWRQGNTFNIALRDFEQLTRVPMLGDETRAGLVLAAQTVGAALWDLLFSDDPLRSTFARATAPGARAVLIVRSDEDMLLSLPRGIAVPPVPLPRAGRSARRGPQHDTHGAGRDATHASHPQKAADQTLTQRTQAGIHDGARPGSPSRRLDSRRAVRDRSTPQHRRSEARAGLVPRGYVVARGCRASPNGS